MTQFAIRRLHLFPAAKFGCLGGLIVAVVPAVLLALLVWNLVSSLSSWLASVAILELPGILPDLNLLQILNLSDLFTSLQNLTDLGWVLVAGLTLALTIAGAIWVMLVAVLATLVYNLVAAVSGGLVYSAETIGPAGKTTVAQPVTPPVNQPAPYLTAPQNPGHRWPLLPGRSSIGSAATNTVVIAGLAEQHADIWRDGAIYVLADRSGGQTWLNGHPPQPASPLREGDRLRLGPYEFVFHTGLTGNT
jgi:hypothetical protein